MDCDSLPGRFRRCESVFDRRELLAQRRDLLVEHVDLGERPSGYLHLLVERGRRRRSLAARGVGLDNALRGGVLEPLLLALSGVERRGKGRNLALVDALLGALQRQEVGQLLDLLIELGERLVLARDLPRQEELREHEHRQEKNDDEQHRRQRVDEARPIVHRLVPASARQRHGLNSSSFRSRGTGALRSGAGRASSS